MLRVIVALLNRSLEHGNDWNMAMKRRDFIEAGIGGVAALSVAQGVSRAQSGDALPVHPRRTNREYPGHLSGAYLRQRSTPKRPQKCAGAVNLLSDCLLAMRDFYG
jgi:hypothetical protein